MDTFQSAPNKCRNLKEGAERSGSFCGLLSLADSNEDKHESELHEHLFDAFGVIKFRHKVEALRLLDREWVDDSSSGQSSGSSSNNCEICLLLSQQWIGIDVYSVPEIFRIRDLRN